MRTDLDEVFPATTKGLHAALGAFDRFCAGRNLDAGLVSRARIIVEELFSNTIKYGYGGECDRPVTLRVTADPVLKLTLKDDAAKFDPTLWRPDHPTDAALDKHEGKAGIALVLGLATQVRYIPRKNGNCVEIEVAG